ncbi:MAG: hypothetical protein V1776_04570 [Candidatus Diapherotrites archaeon]
MGIIRRVKRAVQKRGIAGQLEKNRLGRAYTQVPFGRLTWKETEAVLKRMRKGGNHLSILARYRKADQKNLNAKRKRGESPYKLSGLGRNEEWVAQQRQGSEEFLRRWNTDPAFRARVEQKLKRRVPKKN